MDLQFLPLMCFKGVCLSNLESIVSCAFRKLAILDLVNGFHGENNKGNYEQPNDRESRWSKTTKEKGIYAILKGILWLYYCV